MTLPIHKHQHNLSQIEQNLISSRSSPTNNEFHAKDVNEDLY